MPDLTFYGASDDLIECEGVVTEEWNGEGGKLLVVCPDGQQAHVWVRYMDPGVWTVAYGPVDEGVPAPAGRVEVEPDSYTSRLTLDVPEKTTVHFLAAVK